MSSGEQLAFAQEDNVLAAPNTPHPRPPTGCLVCVNSKAHQRADRYMNSEYRRVKWQPGCDGMRFGTVDGVLVWPPPPLAIALMNCPWRIAVMALFKQNLNCFHGQTLFPPAPLQTNKWDLGESNKSDSASIVLFFSSSRGPPPSPPPPFPFIFSRGKSLAQREEADGGGEAV